MYSHVIARVVYLLSLRLRHCFGFGFDVIFPFFDLQLTSLEALREVLLIPCPPPAIALRLPTGSIGVAGVRATAEALKTNATLHTLSISSNDLGAEDGRVIVNSKLGE